MSGCKFLLTWHCQVIDQIEINLDWSWCGLTFKCFIYKQNVPPFDETTRISFVHYQRKSGLVNPMAVFLYVDQKHLISVKKCTKNWLTFFVLSKCSWPAPFQFAASGHCITGKQCHPTTVGNNKIYLCSKQCSLYFPFMQSPLVAKWKAHCGRLLSLSPPLTG